jgi:hypothetical protein
MEEEGGEISHGDWRVLGSFDARRLRREDVTCFTTKKKMARYCGIVLLPLHFCLTLSGFCVYACFIVSFWILVWAV